MRCWKVKREVNPLQPNISLHVVHTVFQGLIYKENFNVLAWGDIGKIRY